VFQPRIPDERGNLIRFESLFENLPAPREVSAHDVMFGVDEVKRAPLVLDIRAEKLRRQLEFELLDPHSVGVAKKKADHAIGEYAINEGIDDGSDFFFPAQSFKETLACRGTHAPITTVSYIIPICNRAASDILLGSQGGSHTKSIVTAVTPGISFTFNSTSAGIDWAAGQ
jgi:hypothetical protein